jgi:hypothetical protein
MFVSGQAYTVDAYLQVQNRNSAPVAAEPGYTSTSVCRQLIRGLIIRITDPLQDEQNPDTGEIKVRGAGQIPVSIIVDRGDVLIGDIGDGRTALLHVTESRRLTRFAASAYSISFTVLGEATPERLAELNATVVRSYQFITDLYMRTGNGLVASGEVSDLMEVALRYNELLDEYLDDFYSSDLRTLMVPGQSELVYDPWVAKFFCEVFPAHEHDAFRHFRQLPLARLKMDSTTSIWDCLRDGSGRRSIRRAFRYYETQATGVNGSVEYRSFLPVSSIAFLDVDYLIVPRGNNTSSSPLKVIRAGDDLNDTLFDHDLTADDDIHAPNLFPNSNYLEGNYVFSPAFFEKIAAGRDLDGITGIERLAVQILDGVPVDVGLLMSLMAACPYLPPVDRFYYTPIILAAARLLPRIRR